MSEKKVELPDYPLLTPERAFATINVELVRLKAGSAYLSSRKREGKYEACAIGLFAVVEKGIERARHMDFASHERIAREIGVPEKYLRGVEDGFELYDPLPGYADSPDAGLGFAHGLLLRYFCEPTSPLERHLEEVLLREGLLLREGE